MEETLYQCKYTPRRAVCLLTGTKLRELASKMLHNYWFMLQNYAGVNKCSTVGYKFLSLTRALSGNYVIISQNRVTLRKI